MVNIKKSQVPGLTGRALLEQVGYHKCASHGQKRYVLAVVAGHSYENESCCVSVLAGQVG
jgi:hypothetical protein